MELYIFARFHVREGREVEASGILLEQTRRVREEPGCLAIDVFASVRDPQLFYLHSRWLDEAAFDRHAELRDTLDFVTRMERLIDHRFDVTRSFRLGR
jgi:quinol monooxygenase YgiN